MLGGGGMDGWWEVSCKLSAGVYYGYYRCADVVQVGVVIGMFLLLQSKRYPLIRVVGLYYNSHGFIYFCHIFGDFLPRTSN